jgi:hypothetical protein
MISLNSYNNLIIDNIKNNSLITSKFFKNLLSLTLDNNFNFINHINKLDNFVVLYHDIRIFTKLNCYDNLISFIMNENYMYPYIENNNHLFVNVDNKVFNDNSLYLINESGELKVRRITQTEPGIDNYKVFSDRKDALEYKEYKKNIMI